MTADLNRNYEIFSDDDGKFWIACDQIIVAGPYDLRATAEEDRDYRVARLAKLLSGEPPA